jgi:hypothetical protein
MNVVAAVMQIVGVCFAVVGFSIWLGAVGGMLSAGAGLFAVGFALERGT